LSAFAWIERLHNWQFDRESERRRDIAAPRNTSLFSSITAPTIP
jgi:hypothetical protein